MLIGFDNLYDLHHLRLLSLANCKRIDDWVLSRIGGIFGESLEMLDLSNCKRISAKGIFSLFLKKMFYYNVLHIKKINLNSILKRCKERQKALKDLSYDF